MVPRPEKPSSSCSTARTEAPPPLETLEAMTIVFCLVIPIPRWENFLFCTNRANLIERRTFLPRFFPD